MKVTGIGVGNYRSIGDKVIWIDLTKKLTLLIGANNSGKSNVLSAISFVCNGKANLFDATQMAPTDVHKLDQKNMLHVCLRGTLVVDDKGYESLGNREWQLGGYWNKHRVEQWTQNPFLKGWNYDSLETVCRAFGVQYGPRQSGIEETMISLISQTLFVRLLKESPLVYVVPQFRQIVPGKGYNIDGSGLVAELASWQNPEFGHDNSRQKFLQVQALLRHLLRTTDVELEVDHIKSHILVKRGNLRLPLESYGTGIHQLILMAVAVYSWSKTVFCIEEPEIHLHPRLQKEFIQFIGSEVDNKFIVSTHSAAFIDAVPDAEIVHITMTDGATVGTVTGSPRDFVAILDDLGYRASDILQANCIIWVEGPSDRIFLNKWISLLEPQFQEGVDYQIMFYGGKLLSHLTMEDELGPSADEMIRLLCINRRSAIIIDSDKSTAKDEINQTKQRIKEECEKGGQICWITQGREIENYLLPKQISGVYPEVIASGTKFKLKKYDHLDHVLANLYGQKWTQGKYAKHKPDQMREFVESFKLEDLGLELKERLTEIVTMIRTANM